VVYVQLHAGQLAKQDKYRKVSYYTMYVVVTLCMDAGGRDTENQYGHQGATELRLDPVCIPAGYDNKAEMRREGNRKGRLKKDAINELESRSVAGFSRAARPRTE
jgi:hypothetical protein